MRAHMVFWVGVSLLRLTGPSCPGNEHEAVLEARAGEEAVACVCAEAVPARGLTITHATWDGKVSTLTRVALCGDADAAVALSIGNDPVEPAGIAHALDGGRHAASPTLVVLVVVSNRDTAGHGAAFECRPHSRPASDGYACRADLSGGIRCVDGVDDDCACDGWRNRSGFHELDGLRHLDVEHDGARRESGGAWASRHATLSSVAHPRAR